METSEFRDEPACVPDPSNPTAAGLSKRRAVFLDAGLVPGLPPDPDGKRGHGENGVCNKTRSFRVQTHAFRLEYSTCNENWEQCLIYLDDILIFGRSAEEHIQRLRTVLQRVREAGLKLSP